MKVLTHKKYSEISRISRKDNNTAKGEPVKVLTQYHKISRAEKRDLSAEVPKC